MKTVNQAVYNAIRSSVQVQAQPRLTAEWNMNRYFGVTATNTPSEDTNGFDIEHFPIESIVKAFRPTKGILKARTDEALVTDLDRAAASRYYTASDDDVYHYWTSPDKTNGSGNFTTTVRPQIVYSESVDINKIVIKVENFWASPKAYTVKTTTTASPTYANFTTVATTPTINNKGEIILYWNGTGWSSTKPSLVDAPLRSVRGIMLEVTSMGPGKDLNGATTTYQSRRRVGSEWIEEDKSTTGFNSFFNLIEISGRREIDFSSNLINVSDQFDIAQENELYPIGTITNNTGAITLSNLYSEGGVQKTGLFNKDNPTSVYRKILEPNVKFNLEYVYTVNGTEYPIQQFEMYGDEWEGQKNHEVTVALTDASKFLEQITPPPAMYENMTVPELFQRILDASGFVNWVLDEDDRNEKHIIPVFWMNGEQNTWEILNDLARGTQTAMYFDGFGNMQVKTRWSAYNNAKTSFWTLRGENAGTELADIIELSEEGEAGTNHVTITYQNTTWDKWNNGSPSMQTVWQPDSTVTLRGCPLTRTMSSTDQQFWISPADAQVWPYKGIVQIEGELIKYEGKQFVYWTGPNGGTRNVVIVKTADEKQKYDRKTLARHRGKNTFSGLMIVSTDDDARGHWNSDKRAHSVDLAPYNVRRLTNAQKTGQAVIQNTSGLQHIKQESLVRLTSATSAVGNDATIATNGATSSTPYKFYGTKVRFVKEAGLDEQRAGIMINGGGTGNADGYFIDLMYFTDNKVREIRNELTIFSSKDGTLSRLSDGVAVAVALNTFYQLDVIFEDLGNAHRITVLFEGRVAMVANIPSGDARFNAANGQFGMFVRGKTKADFEYLYGVARNEKVPNDDSTFFDLVRGGYTGDHFVREFVWGWKTRKVRKKKKWTKETYRWNQYYFDEFGPYVHEVREFDIKFEPAPVKNSRLYFTNEWGVICPEYRSNPFGARFLLTNVSRRNEVAHGDDNITFGAERTVPQVLSAIGRILVMAEEETVVRKNEASIKVRGNVESELSSPWIQTKAMANNIANWMNSHWSEGMDELTVKVFGNPLIELTDVVSVQYAEKHMAPTTHKYFVNSISTDFEAGITTTLRLRRVQI